jgi:PAS domain S-box-containing protein
MIPPDGRHAGSYDYLVAVVAVCVSVLASYTALDLGERITAASGIARRVWLISGGVVLGIGIWSMHYIAMWAFRLPVPVRYDWPTTLLSLSMGIAGSMTALAVVSLNTLGIRAAFLGSIFQGAAIAGLHYTAMASMRMPAVCRFSPPIVTLSVLIAIAGSAMSLWLTFLFRNRPGGQLVRRVSSATLMGAAISTMHFTGMAAATFYAINEPTNFSHAVRVTTLGVTGVITVSGSTLVGTIVTALVDRLREKSAQLGKLFEQSPLPVIVVDEGGRVLRINPEFTRVFGFATQEALHRRLCELIAPGDLARDFETKELSNEGARPEADTVRQRKDGSQLHVLVVSVPITLPGRKKEVWAIYRDVSERKAAESALQSVSSRLLEVQESERRHLASELHDEIGQQLTGLRLLLKLNRDASVEVIRSRSEQAQSIVDDLLAAVRRLSFDLRPADLDQFGLLPALLGLFERYTAQTGILVDFKHRDVDRRFLPNIETAAYRVVQEGLTNAARHAGVAGVTVRLWMEENKLNVQVDDRGRGFDLDVVMKEAKSSGLFGMSDRVNLVGGHMNIESAPGSGTTISVELPVDGSMVQ